MKKYESYKDSGVGWIGKIPSHWSCVPFRRIAKVQCNLVRPSENLTMFQISPDSIEKNSGKIIKTRTVEEAKVDSDNHRFYKGQILYSKIRPLLNKVTIAPYDGLCSADMYPISTIENTEYVMYYMLSEAFLSSVKNIVEDKTLKIEQYVSARERERELLDSLKQSEIANVVTKGLNSNVRMKDSGIPWIGMIPEHWETRTLSQMARVHFISNKNVHHQNLLSLSYGKIVCKDINTTEGLLPASFDNYQIVEDGNIVLRLTDLQNDHKSLRVGLSTQEGIITSAYLAIEAFTGILPKYLYFLLHSIDVKKVFYSMGNGLRQSLNWTELRKLKCIVPPILEQQAIVDYIEAKLSKIDSCMADLQAEIDYLKEFKQRLISDVVTGQICVAKPQRGEQQ